MKIGQVIHTYWPHIGGIENYALRLSKFLEAEGHQVTIYTTDLSFQGQSRTRAEGNARYCKTNLSVLRNPFSWEFRRILSQSGEDIYHLHSPWFLTSLQAAWILRNKPKVMTVHSAEIRSRNLATKILNTCYSPFAKYALSHMDRLITLGEKEKDVLSARFGLLNEKIISIPNGIETGSFRRDENEISAFLNKTGIRPDTFKILFVSRLVEAKNPEKLIGAAVKYMQDERGIELILIGGGDADRVNYLRQISDDRVHILGEVSQQELVAAYNISDLFVFLGSWEGMPTVIFEAMSCGLPILTVPVGGIPDVITEGENGFFISLPVNEEELSYSIRHIMKNVDLPRIREANRQKVSQNYSWEIIQQRILEVYTQVLKERA
ncbi:glycosyltransferase family 4 protein [Chloroflexota bacterium]